MERYGLAVVEGTPSWAPLPWNGCWVSLRAAGDLGPSGFDLGAVERRRAACGRPDAPQPIDGAAILVAQQTHSLCILCPLANGNLEVWEGAWIPAPGGERLSIKRAHIENWDVGHPELLEARLGTLEADGWLTDDVRLHLGVTVADCMSLFVTGKAQGDVRALLHSGWQGTGILAVAMAALESLFGISAGDVEVMSGPAIAAADYPVHEERAVLFERRFGPTAVIASPEGRGRCLNLVAANAALLSLGAPCLARNGGQASGVPCDESLEIDYLSCRTSTISSPVCHSFRRDGKDGYGRMLALWAGRPV